MADIEELPESRFDDIDLESILARVERRGPLLFTRKRCLYRAPEFVKRLSGETTVDEGSTVRFECRIVGIPTPTVKWTKDDEEIPDDKRIKTEATENGEYFFTVEKVKKRDEGAYRIKAENAEGSSSSTIYLAIKVKSKKAKRSNRVMQHPSGFTPIAEKITEEEQEEEITKTQPDSPLTHLYSGNTRHNRTWPEFLGSWAFANAIGRNDFDDLSDNEDEDVFSTDGSCDSFSVNGSDVLPRCENNGYSDSDSENEITNLLHGNLIFENQKLAQSSVSNDIIAIDNFSAENIHSERDARTNCETQIKYANQGKESNIAGNNITNCESSLTSSNASIFPDVDVTRGTAIYDCTTETLAPISLQNQVTNVASSLRRLSSQDQYDSAKVSTEDHRENYSSVNIPWMEVVFLASLITFIALNTKMAPTSFVSSIIAAQIVYCVMRYLLDSLVN